MNQKMITSGKANGYELWHLHRHYHFQVYDYGINIENIINTPKGEITQREQLIKNIQYLNIDDFKQAHPKEYQFILHLDEQVKKYGYYSSIEDLIDLNLPKNISRDLARRAAWHFEREREKKGNDYEGYYDIMPYYLQQKKLASKIKKHDEFERPVINIAGVDLGYSQIQKKLIVVIVIFNLKNNEIIEKVIIEKTIDTPYIHELYSFIEYPIILDAFKRLNVVPQLILFNGQGILHPLEIGTASHLGFELNIPTIGCTTNRLVGYYASNQLGQNEGAEINIRWNSQDLGKALRTISNEKEIFVSIGHKISIQSSLKWVLSLCSSHFLPEPLVKASAIMKKLITKDRVSIFNLEG